ncbi:MAG: Dodecaprenyl-phosphate galacturonate synthase [Elusimicrobia bacterium]|nr:Dodecaprenyl-phosphate galacturonate synthase [Elusimicrobiota bacterium]
MNQESKEILSVILPAYNEEDCILSTIDEVESTLTKAKIPFEILIIDDGSKDSTVNLAKTRNVRIIQHRRNLGVGAARKTGILNSKGKVVVTTDVDGTYPNDQIPRLYKHFQENNCDMVVGARIGKNVVFEWPHRSIPKYIIRKLASYLCEFHIPDLNSGLRIIKRSVALKYFYLLPNSHSWESTITLAFLCNNRPTDFLPIDYFKRKGGRSTFAPIKDTYNYISLVIRTIMYFSPLRFFIPLSFFVISSGLIKMVYDWFTYRHIGSVDVIIVLGGLFIILAGLLADSIVVNGRRTIRPDENEDQN